MIRVLGAIQENILREDSHYHFIEPEMCHALGAEQAATAMRRDVTGSWHPLPSLPHAPRSQAHQAHATVDIRFQQDYA